MEAVDAPTMGAAVTRALSYADAVRLLGGRQHPIARIFDQLAGAALITASGAGSALALSLFDAKAEISRLGGELIADLSDRLDGLNRFKRGERILAANAVLVVTAYFEAMADAALPFTTDDLRLTRAEQVQLAGAAAPGSGRIDTLAEVLLQADVPTPTPHRPYESTMVALRAYYDVLSESFVTFVAGLMVWDRLTGQQRDAATRALRQDVPGHAVARYEEYFRRLAVDVPEVGLWATLLEHRAAHRQLTRVVAGVSGLDALVRQLNRGRLPEDRRLALTRAYRGALSRPIVHSGDAPEGLRIPTLGTAYVNPRFRVVEVAASDRLSFEWWWHERPVHRDLQTFLFAYLTAPHATTAPLLVLGQPGSGKSVLTQILAASLPATDFAVVRVPLRDVPIELDLQGQIEYAVRAATGEGASWLDLVHAADGALPVVLLDGFDELLQTTGVSQSDYLERIAEFQRRETDQERGVAVIVTSRTSVADQARPTQGMVAVRLEPFDADDIAAWLAVWEATNATYFRQRRLRPLDPAIALLHPQLASQPLLLLMLALYDADANALQRDDLVLSQADLYERLLTRFAVREIAKTPQGPSPDGLDGQVEHELLRLSVVACAMFNRGRQWIAAVDLDADLAVLLPQPTTARATLRAPLSPAQLLLGRFFFIHEAVSSRDAMKLRSYEFLHATFGEYLVARLVARELADLTAAAEFATVRNRRTPHDDAFLHALLSFSPLTGRGTTVGFLRDILAQLPPERRQLSRAVLLDLFRPVLDARQDNRFADYTPRNRSVPARHATYAANLLVLLLLVVESINCSDLFGSGDSVKQWRDLAMLWRSQLSSDGFTGLLDTVRLERRWDGDQREIRIGLAEAGDDNHPLEQLDLYWTAFVTPDAGFRGGSIWSHDTSDHLWRVRHFGCDYGDDLVASALETMHRQLGMTVNTIHGIWTDRAASSADALIALMLARAGRAAPSDLADAYDVCLDIALHPYAFHNDRDMHARYQALVINQLTDDGERLPAGWLAAAHQRILAREDPHTLGPPPASEWTMEP